MKSLKQLQRDMDVAQRRAIIARIYMRAQWWNPRRLWKGLKVLRLVKRQQRAVMAIVKMRTSFALRSALPNRQQRAMGLKPQINAN